MANKFYVPEIGDTIKLSEDFTFDLHAENRNSDLASAFGHYISYYREPLIINAEELPPMRDPDFKVEYPSHDEFKKWNGRLDTEAWNKAAKAAEEACEARTKYYEDLLTYNEKAAKAGKKSVQITLPKGTELKVDRIYIRKGASEFSSITFKTISFGKTEVKHPWRTGSKSKNSLRFWVKLQDCNRIVFE